MSATETDKMPVQADGTAEEEWYLGESRSLENLRHMRLMALLRDMMESGSIEKAAQALGQDGPARWDRQQQRCGQRHQPSGKWESDSRSR